MSFNQDSQFGLDETRVSNDLLKYGKNILGGDGGPSIWKVLFANIFNSMNLILGIALVVSIVILDWIKMAVLLFVIVTNSGIGFVQEYKSEKTMDALRKLASPSARVLRKRDWIVVPASDIVPGDIVSLQTGDICPADLRLIEVVNLQNDEAFLTGESVPVSKITAPVVSKEDGFVNVGDRINCAYMNSHVIRGRGVGIAIATGFTTEVGKIAKAVSEDEGDKKTPLMKYLEYLMFGCAGAALVLGVVVFAAEKFVWSVETFLYAISVGIAILPEGLPAVVTVAMALGLRKMSKQKALVRKLAAIEAVGQVTNVCSDKTGTLTEGKMVVKYAWINGVKYIVTGIALEPIGEITMLDSPNLKITNEVALQDFALSQAFQIASLCNTSNIFFDPEENKWKAHGDPTEIALNVFAAKVDFTKDSFIQHGWEMEQEYPFESAIKRMTTIYKTKNTESLYLTKGALERVLDVSSSIFLNGETEPLTETNRQLIHDVMLEFAKKGMRILALASKTSTTDSRKVSRRDAESGLSIFGLLAIYDPPRVESRPSVLECQRAGITVHMATGDHPGTAEAIAREVGILKETDPSGAPLVLPAHVFDSMSEAEIDALEELPRVLARCAPESKVTLVNALHRRNKFVAMTGDGVNDAPAVKRADIGIAMGIAGSDVTKQASSITLTDDNFKTILVAIREGRRLFTNITNIVQHLLSGNVSEVIVLVIGLSLRDTSDNAVFPMSAIQILWLNMVTSSPVALSLGVEVGTVGLMDMPPRKKEEKVLNFELILDIAFYGFVLGIFSLGTFIAFIHTTVGLSNMAIGCGKRYTAGVCDEIFQARALAFYSLSLLILVHGFNCRSSRNSIFRKGQEQNKALWGSILAGAVTTLPTAFIPVINTGMFEQLGFPAIWWVPLILQIVIFIGISELFKMWKRWYYSRHTPTSVAPTIVAVEQIA